MTTATMQRPGAGYSSLRRGNSVTMIEAGTEALAERLAESYQRPAVFRGYMDTVDELEAAVANALGDLTPASLARLDLATGPALDFLINRPDGVVPPTVDVWESGVVALEWYSAPDRIVTVTIDERGRLIFSAIVGVETMASVRALEGTWPGELLTWISRVKG